jgi:hypothetical protein
MVKVVGANLIGKGLKKMKMLNATILSSHKDIKKFVKERNAALLSMDENKIRKTFSKYGVELSYNQIIFWAAIHKARMEVSSFSDEVKAESAKWLTENGFYPGIQ